MKKTIIALIALLSASLYAQSTETLIELVKSNLQVEKKGIIAEAMELNSEQSDKFWPIYNEYEKQVSKLIDQKVAIIKEYAENYDSLTNAVAEDLVEKSFDLEEERLKLEKETYNKVKEVLNAKYAGKFIQLVSRINKIINIQLASEIPLIPADEKTSK
jgi:hypothetical protein